MAGLIDITLGNFTKFYITETTDFDTLVTNVQSVGELSDESTIVDVAEYNVKYMRKLVGSASAGPIELVVNFDPSDASYVLLESFYKAGTRFAAKLEMLTSDESAGSFITFNALCASKSFSNEFDGVRTVTFSIVIDGAISDVTANPA